MNNGERGRKGQRESFLCVFPMGGGTAQVVPRRQWIPKGKVTEQLSDGLGSTRDLPGVEVQTQALFIYTY